MKESRRVSRARLVNVIQIGLILMWAYVYSTQAFAASGNKAIADAVVHPEIKQRAITKVAIFPLKAVDGSIAGESIAGLLSTELLKTGKYRLANRAEMEALLTLIQADLAVGNIAKMGKPIGVDAKIEGTVSEYGTVNYKNNDLPSVAFTLKMTSLKDTEELWSISTSGVGRAGETMAGLARQLVRDAIKKLTEEWIKAGDTYALNMRSANIAALTPGRRKVILELTPNGMDTFKEYVVYRSTSIDGNYRTVKTVRNKKSSRALRYIDSKLESSATYYYKVIGVAPSGLHGKASEIKSVSVL